MKPNKGFLKLPCAVLSLITKVIHIHGQKFGKYRKAQRKKFIHIPLLGCTILSCITSLSFPFSLSLYLCLLMKISCIILFCHLLHNSISPHYKCHTHTQKNVARGLVWEMWKNGLSEEILVLKDPGSLLLPVKTEDHETHWQCSMQPTVSQGCFWCVPGWSCCLTQGPFHCISFLPTWVLAPSTAGQMEVGRGLRCQSFGAQNSNRKEKGCAISYLE